MLKYIGLSLSIMIGFSDWFVSIQKPILVHRTFMMEICDNGIDDDGDGLVDCYDDDCFSDVSCDDFYYGNPVPSCQFQPPAADTFILELVLETDSINYPVDQRCAVYVGDMDGDGIPELVGKDPSPARIQIFSGVDGSIKQSITVSGNTSFSQLALADVDENGMGDIFMLGSSGQLIRYEYGTATALWTTGNNIGDPTDDATPQVADFDYDGTPEVYVGNRIFNSLNGTRLAIGSGSTGQNHPNGDKYSIAYDVFQNGDLMPGGGTFGTEADGLELIAGNQVYTVELGDGTTDNGTLTVVSEATNASLTDGFTSISDVDGDGEIDIIVMDSGNIYVWNPRTEGQIGSTYSITGTSRGGRINVGDFDGDGAVELGAAGRHIYVVLEYNSGLNTLEEKWIKTGLDDGSQMTGSTLFDFEGDGLAEVVYSEEEHMYVWRGTDGTELVKIVSQSGTRTDYPLVADVNNDGASEIILTAQGGNGPSFSGNGFIRVFKSKTTPWVVSRPVWNQSGYFNVNINNDLTVPSQQQNPLHPNLNGAFNNFLVQATKLNINGEPTFEAADAIAIIAAIDSTLCPDSVGLTMNVKNLGANNIPSGMPIAVYSGDPSVVAATLLGTVETTAEISIGDSVLLVSNFDISMETLPIDIYVIAADTGFLEINLPYDLATDFPVFGVGECDFINNLSASQRLECMEICNDMSDNDGDGLTDCDDSDCRPPAPAQVLRK